MTRARPLRDAPAGWAPAGEPAAGRPPVVALPQTRRFVEKREAILDAAARVFNRHGVRGGTLADVAHSVGLITNSVTYYYRRKEDLAAACLLRSIAAVDAIAAQACRGEDAERRLRGFVSGHARLLAEIAEGRQAELVGFSDIRALPSPHLEKAFAAYTDMFRAVRRVLPEGSGFDRRDLNARAHLLLSLVNWMRAWIRRYEPDDYERVAQRIGDILVHGMARSPQQWAERAGPEIGWPQPAAGDLRTPEAFLHAATRLVNEQGYRGASVERISARLNLTKGSFYHHHDNKDGLIAACFERSFDVIRQTLAIAAARPGSGWDRLTASARALVRYQLSEQGPLLRTTAWSALPELLRGDTLLTMNRLTERFGGFVIDGMLDGSIRPLDPSVAAQLVSAMINAASELERWVPGISTDNAARVYVQPLFVGLLRPVPEPDHRASPP
jgi:AcrR family transcriptional regulator